MTRKRGSTTAFIVVVAAVFAILVIAFVFNSKISAPLSPANTPAGSGFKNTDSHIYRKLQMGTLVEITVLGGDKERFDKAIGRAFRKIHELENLFSSYEPPSDVSRISGGAGQGPVTVSADVVQVALKAKEVAKLTDGAFDPTIGSLAGLWGYSGEKGIVPTLEELKKVLPHVNYKKILIDKEASTVELADPGVAFNLGGIAKGYIIGQAVEVLKKYGITRAIIKAGGDMFTFNVSGKKKRPFKIGIRDPRGAETDIIGEVYLTNGAVATSGDYERFFMVDGKRYHHILNPKTGMPAMKTRSATVVTIDPTLADALSTGVFVLGPAKGMALIERLEGVEGVIVSANGKITTSSGFKGKIY